MPPGCTGVGRGRLIGRQALKTALIYWSFIKGEDRAPADRCWRNGPGRWHFPGWPGWMDTDQQSSGQHATSQSQHHPSCTEHSARRAHQAL